MYYCFAVKVRLHISRLQRVYLDKQSCFAFGDEQEEVYDKFNEVIDLEFPVCSKTPCHKEAVKRKIIKEYPCTHVRVEEIFSNPITATDFAELSAL